MAQLTIQVNGRPYTVGCEDGQEAHLLEIARLFDRQVRQVSQDVGQQQGAHQEQTGVAQLAHVLGDLADLAVKDAGQFDQVLFLAILAADGIGAAVHLDDHLGHGLDLFALVGGDGVVVVGQGRLDLGDGATERRRGLGPGVLQGALAGAGLVQCIGELGAVLVEQAAGLLAGLRRARSHALFQLGDRAIQPLGGLVEGAIARRLPVHSTLRRCDC